MKGHRFLIAGLLSLLAVSGCDWNKELPVPTAEQADGYFESERVSAAVNGNVVTLTVGQPAEYLRRGGSLWAKSTPYLYLFSSRTRQMFSDFEGLGGVRVVTRVPGGEEVARALLRRDTLNGITWARALLAGAQAMQDGTREPQKLRDLVEMGERLAEYSYNRKYVPSG